LRIIGFDFLAIRCLSCQRCLGRKMQNQMFRIWTIAATFLLLCGLANADSQYGKFRHFSNLPTTAFMIGEITNGDSFDFRKLLRNHEINTLVISSPGGSVWEALSIAGIVSDNNTNVYIPKNANCYSACSFIFFAGKSRIAKGKLGVHQFSSVESNAQKNVGVVEGGTQFTTSEIIGFLNEFDTPAWVYEKMFAQKEMYVFNSGELDTLERGIMAGFQASSVEQFIKSSKLKLNQMDLATRKVEAKPKWKIEYVPIYLTPVSGEWVLDDTGYENTFRILAKNESYVELQTPSFFFKPRDCGRYSKNIVLQVQNKLRNQGFDVGTPDGLIGNKTVRGISAFQKKRGLKVTSKIDNKLLSTLGVDDDIDYIQGPLAIPLTYPIPPNQSLFIDIPYLYSYVANKRFCYKIKAQHRKKIPAN